MIAIRIRRKETKYQYWYKRISLDTRVSYDYSVQGHHTKINKAATTNYKTYQEIQYP
jgi:hypothetical protein